MGKVSSELSELNLLLEISLILNRSKNIQDDLQPILTLLAQHCEMERASISILNRSSSEVVIEAAYSLTPSEKANGTYKIGEGLIGKVAESGQAMVLAKVSDHDPFGLPEAGVDDHNQVSFICIPIKIDNEVVGTISMDRQFHPHQKLDKDLHLATLVGSMIAHNVRLRQEQLEEVHRLQEENIRLHGELKAKFNTTNLIGTSNRMQDVFRMIEKVANTNTTVLVTGESGVGKELVANAIHYNSPRSDGNFIKVNCSALPETLIESELFGHEKGAFTGADKMRKGRFEMADGGTIFLDEIGDIPLATQVKILRILQEREFERLGSTKTVKVDVRIITATNRNLEDMIGEGKFREDLYYRLNVFPVYVPPLRERKTDITLLTDHFINKFNNLHNKQIKRIATSAIDMLISYHWPGNVRELENCIERATILCNDDVIYGYHLPPSLQTPEATSASTRKGPLQSILSKVEKELIQDTLKLTHGNISQAAENLGITERMMGIRINKYKIDPKRYKLQKN
jgi:Nif-specific regulatory protein